MIYDHIDNIGLYRSGAAAVLSYPNPRPGVFKI